MRINTNIASVNTLRQLGKSNEMLGRTFGRLSSGFRINRAADDAAGLGIANRLRADIRSMQQASRNAEQANSLLQVAEGAAQTISGIVERMKELGIQAASDNVSNTDRTLIDAEFQELKSEITRIVDTTEFQGAALVNGSLGNAITGGTLNATAAGVQSVSISGAATGTYTMAEVAGVATLSDGTGAGSMTESIATVAGQGTLNFNLFGVQIETDAAYTAVAQLDGLTVTVGGGNTEFVVSVSGDYSGQDRVLLGSLDLQLTTLGLNAEDMLSKAGAVSALTAVDSSITVVSASFGTIGAAQNRLDFARANVNTTVENFQAAESVIRDADMAYEVTQMTKFQVLQQAGTAILAQANQTPQGVLQLLR